MGCVCKEKAATGGKRPGLRAYPCQLWDLWLAIRKEEKM